MSVVPYIRLVRPQQWVKNAFVFAAPMFAGVITQPPEAVRSLVVFVSFCLASSAVYVLNDVVDLARDRAHPTKKLRPLPAGQAKRGPAVILALLLSLFSLGLALGIGPSAAGVIVAAYLIANILYSFYFKQVVILDVMFLALGFILRVLAGAAATAVPPSHWLLLCTLMVSLFLGFTKRRAELVGMNDAASNHREVLEHYSAGFLDQMIAIVTGATLVCYILYTVDERTVRIFGSYGLVATVPFVLYGLFRYLYLSYHREGGGSPTETILRDWPFLVNLILWGVTCLAVIYKGPIISKWLPWPAL